jgi:hypothetical protein
MPAKLTHSLIFLSLLIAPFAANAVDNAPQSTRYVRVTRSLSFQEGGQETGQLLLSPIKNNRAKFSLEVSWSLHPNEDGAAVSLGTIKEGEVIFQGSQGRYVSKDNGQTTTGCVLIFRKTGANIILTQQSQCPWFGIRADAGGFYLKASGNEVILVR